MQHAEVVLRIGQTLLGSGAVPADCLVQSRVALSRFEHHGEPVLRLGQSLLGGRAIPAHRLGAVGRDPAPVGVKVAQHQLTVGQPGLGRAPVELCRPGHVRLDAVAGLVADALLQQLQRLFLGIPGAGQEEEDRGERDRRKR